MGRITAAAACLAVLASAVAAQQPPPPAAPAPKTAPAPAPAAAPAAGGKSEAAKPAGRIEYFEIDSKLTGQKVNVGVYLPAEYDGSKDRYPVLYFLHGLYYSAHRYWEERHTNLTIDELVNDGKIGPLLVVSCDGKNSMYVNSLDGKAKWGDFVATELVQAVDAKYRTIADRGARGVNGDSMGGYGALNVAFKHPDVFGSVSAHSAAIYPVDPQQIPDWIKQRGEQWKPIYGWPIDVPHWEEWNPLKEAATLPVETLQKIKIYFDCGDKDRFGFDKSNEALHKILEERKVEHEWHLRSGNHGRDYYEEYCPLSFEFHAAIFDAAPKGDAKNPKH
jgi:S-formylglutathione hydrolase FrmB